MPDYVFTASAGVAIILCIVPGIIHVQTRNWGAIFMTFWVLLTNTIIFINSILWANDLDDKAPVYCYITTPLYNAAHFGIMASAVCMIHTLHNYVVKPTLLTENVRRRQISIHLFLSIIFPFILVALTYLNIKTIYGLRPVLGCSIQVSNTWVYIVVDAMWPLIISGTGCYFAARTAYTIIKKGLEIQSLLKYSKSGLNISKFYRLVFFCITFLIIAFPAACLTFFSNLKELAPYDFDEIHKDFFVIKKFDNGVSFIDYVKPLTGLILFAFFGTGRDAKQAYLRWAKKLKLDLVCGCCINFELDDRTSSNGTTSTMRSFNTNNSRIGSSPRSPRSPQSPNINNSYHSNHSHHSHHSNHLSSSNNNFNNNLMPPEPAHSNMGNKIMNFLSGHKTPTEQAEFDLTSGIRIRIDGLDTKLGDDEGFNDELLYNNDKIDNNDDDINKNQYLLKPAPAYLKSIYKTLDDDQEDGNDSKLRPDISITIHNDSSVSSLSSSSTLNNNTPPPKPAPSEFIYDGDSFGDVDDGVNHIDVLLSVYPEENQDSNVPPIVEVVPPTPAFVGENEDEQQQRDSDYYGLYNNVNQDESLIDNSNHDIDQDSQYSSTNNSVYEQTGIAL